MDAAVAPGIELALLQVRDEGEVAAGAEPVRAADGHEHATALAGRELERPVLAVRGGVGAQVDDDVADRARQAVHELHDRVWRHLEVEPTDHAPA